MTRQPLLFVSHGAPDLLLHDSATAALWSGLAAQLPKPRAILVISAHWGATSPTVSAAPQPATIHDFGGFPPALYAMQYPAPGAPALAERVLVLLRAAGLPDERDMARGLDHGAWIPLKCLHPGADVPVTQLALQPTAGPEWHFRLGAALAPLRDEGVLILASGAVTHNFGWLTWRLDAPIYEPAREFADWVGERIAAGAHAELLDYRRQAPHGTCAHPTEEHLHPLFVALGAAQGETAQRLQSEYNYGGLAMDAYLWQEEASHAN
jgi:4,5-DOPA dioxygenase extradiol